MQVNHEVTRSSPLRAELTQQFQSSQHFSIGLIGMRRALLQKIGSEGTIEIAIAVTTTLRAGLRIADGCLNNTSTGIDQVMLRRPLIQKPEAIDLVAMGTCHHQHSGACHLSLHSSTACRTIP